jgi:hypothetical protein
MRNSVPFTEAISRSASASFERALRLFNLTHVRILGFRHVASTHRAFLVLLGGAREPHLRADNGDLSIRFRSPPIPQKCSKET